METQTISSEKWVQFFDQFSRDHLGWPVTIEILDPQTGPQNLAMHLPLEGISFDTQGTRPSSISIDVGDDPERHMSHTIDLPLHIREMEDTDGYIELQIEPAQGPVTLLHLREPMH